VSAERIGEVLDTVERPSPTRRPRHRTGTGASSCGVEFTYPGADAPVLQDITFARAPAQTTAIIGSTGAGKTTLVNLVPRLFDATGGRSW
jgi:ATP-binding cassette subfamily B multidrug efflux pump